MALAECCIASGTEGGALTAAPPPALGAAIVARDVAATRHRAVRRGSLARRRQLLRSRPRRAPRPRRDRRAAGPGPRHGCRILPERHNQRRDHVRPSRHRAPPGLRVAARAPRLAPTPACTETPRCRRCLTAPTGQHASDHFHDACGVFGIFAPDHDVARLTFFGLYALQHRGQESAGIAVADGGQVTVVKDMGLVSQRLRREGARRPHRHARDRPRALLDDRRHRLAELAAARARPQRQHRSPWATTATCVNTHGAARRAASPAASRFARAPTPRSSRRSSPHHAETDLDAAGAHRREQDPRRLLGDGADAQEDRRLPRPVRRAAALPRRASRATR